MTQYILQNIDEDSVENNLKTECNNKLEIHSVKVREIIEKRDGKHLENHCLPSLSEDRTYLILNNHDLFFKVTKQLVSKQHEVVLVILTIGTSSTFTVSLVFPVSVCTVSLPSLMGSYSTSLITKFSYWISDYFNQPLFSSNVCFLKIWCAKLDCTLETVALKGQRGLNHHFIPVMYNFCIYFLVCTLVFATALYC